MMTAGDTLGRYFAALERQKRFSPAAERSMAERIARLRRTYWEALLSHATLAPQVRTAAARELEVDTPDALAEADPCSDVADLLFADVQGLQRGEPGSSFALPAEEREGLATYVARVDRARVALHEARRAFARANLRLVVTLANRYRRSGRLSLPDLIQEGNVGLMAAIDRFDPGRGFRFSTYAAWWIKHAIGRALSNRGRVVRLPSHIIELQSKLARIEGKFEVEHGRRPDVSELASAAGVSVRRVRRLARSLVEQSLPSGEGDGELDGMPTDAVDAEAALDAVQVGSALGEAMAGLAPMEAEVVALRFGFDGGDGRTLREIGSTYSLSRERIRQIQARALGKLRDHLASRGHATPPAPAAYRFQFRL